MGACFSRVAVPLESDTNEAKVEAPAQPLFQHAEKGTATSTKSSALLAPDSSYPPSTGNELRGARLNDASDLAAAGPTPTSAAANLCGSPAAAAPSLQTVVFNAPVDPFKGSGSSHGTRNTLNGSSGVNNGSNCVSLRHTLDSKLESPCSTVSTPAMSVAESAPPVSPTADADWQKPTTLQPAGYQTMAPEQLAKEVQQLSWVGHGGYGAVYKGVWQGATVAAKYTVADQIDLQGARAHEAVLSKILSHPNVVQTFASRVAILTEDFLKATFNGDAMYASQTYNSDSGFKSGDGFGNPYGNTTTSIRFADVLTHVGAKPGSVMTQMIMECCDRGSLHSAIAKGLFKSSSKWNNKIALRALLRTAREIAQGMSHLHMSRVVHGDLKPGNVLLMSSRADRRGFIAKVSDFGLSNFCISSHISTSRWSTVAYMSGEAFDGRVTMASDVYSFGVMLWEMYTGTPPHAGLQPAQVVLGVQSGQLALAWPAGSDPRILSLVMSCVVHDPTARPTFKQLINDLASLEAQVRVEASAGPPPPNQAPERQQPQPTAISLGMLLGSGGPPVADPASVRLQL